MDSPRFEQIWRALLPPRICFSVGGEASTTVLSASERRSIEGAGTRRMREFSAGRWHAKRALTALGLDVVDLPRLADGSPRWPDGVVGSLSHAWHGEGLEVIAVAALNDEIAAVGVDLEAPGRIEPSAWPGLVSPAQLDRILALPPAQRGEAVRAAWCAKEAAAKAGRTARALPEMEVTFSAGDRFGAGDCTGRVVHDAGWTFAVAVRFAFARGAASV